MTLKFITIGDPHIMVDPFNSPWAIDIGGNDRLKVMIEYINKMTNIDFVVFLGDITESGRLSEYELFNNIISTLNKNYYVVQGNHELFNDPDGTVFKQFYGTPQKIININGYQLLMIGLTINDLEVCVEDSWVFDFNNSNIDFTAKTIVFFHHPVVRPPTEFPVDWTHTITQTVYYPYNLNIELNRKKFSNLLAVISGHTHHTTQIIRNNILYTTLDGLNSNKPWYIISKGTDKIGYYTIDDMNIHYELINTRI